MTDDRDQLDRVQELFDFLTGTLPEGYGVSDDNMPTLTPDQAWTVIWYLGNQYWQVPDYIERCGVCGNLYDSERGGTHTEAGPPYQFCENCQHLSPENEQEPHG